jgi:bifunctional enzyme CysN/CysC
MSSKDQLRFMTCGSVDDGKSTLVGRLLYESQNIYQDHLQALERDSRRHGTTGSEIDFALLADGLEAEREQNITIDVAYRYFATARRSFVIVDTPGHEQYTRNMATGASNAQLAVVLIDARKGLLPQTKRHSLICALLGIRHVVVAVNKMDLVDYRRENFDRIADGFLDFAVPHGFKSIAAIPISARRGDNIVTRSRETPWYDGACLLDHLESIDVGSDDADTPFRFPVQWVNRPTPDFRGYAGTVASGTVAVGDDVMVAVSGRRSRIRQIVTHDGDRDRAEAGEAVTIRLVDEIDIGRGDLFAKPGERPEVADQFAAKIIWMDQHPLFAGRPYAFRIGTQSIAAGSITAIKHKIDVNSGAQLAARALELNEIGFCNVSLAAPAAFDAYEQNRRTGCFIMIDRHTNHTVGAGMIAFALRRADNIAWQPLAIGRNERAALKQQRPFIVWFTGLSGAGKSTVANLVEQKLAAMSYHTMLLDGDNFRHGLNRDLGFTEADRVENIRRAGEVAKLLVDSGLIAICSFISPYAAERDMVRGLMGEGEFIEVFVDTPIEVCERRDPKRLYARARAGELKNFTGIDSPYEAPTSPEVHLKALGEQPEALADVVLGCLEKRGLLRRV